METRIGEWYLCEGYIEEPVKVEALDHWCIQVRYLTTGRTRWLGYPRIWEACKPHPLPYDVGFDSRNCAVLLQLPDGSDEPARLSLQQLRGRFFPHLVERRRPEPRTAPQPAAADRQVEWAEELARETEADDPADDDETDLELDMSY